MLALLTSTLTAVLVVHPGPASASTWSVSLATSDPNPDTGLPSTLTATASDNVAGTGYLLIRDQAVGGLSHSCSDGRSCDWTLPAMSAGVHSFVATVQVNTYEGIHIFATSASVIVTVAADWTVSISMDHAPGPNSPTTFYAKTNHEVNANGAYIRIYDHNTYGGSGASCTSGTMCSFTLPADFPAGPHSFYAQILSGQNLLAESADIAITVPAPYDLTLTADDASPAAGVQPTITAKFNLDLASIGAALTIRDATTRAGHSCSTGRTCSWTPPDLAAGQHSFTASVTVISNYTQLAATATDLVVTIPVSYPTNPIPAPALSVGVELTNPTFAAGDHATLTATASADVGPTGAAILLVDTTVGSTVGICGSGTSCSAPVSFGSGGPHTYRAQLVTGAAVTAASGTVTATRQAWTVTLATSVTTNSGGFVVNFTATTNQDENQTPFSLVIADYLTGASIGHSCYSGTTCSTHLGFPASAGPHIYFAQLVNGTAVEAASDSYLIAGSGPLLPGEASGGGNPAEKVCQCSHADPVNTATGELWETATDIGLGGRGPALAVGRTYSSLAAATDGPFGYGWSASFAGSLKVLTAGNTADPLPRQVQITQENGSTVVFTEGPDHHYLAPPRVLASLSYDSATQRWTFTRQRRQVFAFDAAGRLVGLRDLHGNADTLTRDANGVLTTIATSDGRSLTLSWTGNHVTRIVDSAGRAVGYAYDANGNLSSVTNVDASIVQYGYATGHYLNVLTHPAGGTVRTTYDSVHRVVSQLDPKARTTTFGYSGDTTTTTAPTGTVTTETYSGGRLVSQTVGAGTSLAATTTRSYDSAGNVTSVTDPVGATTTYTYNASGDPLTRTDPLNRTTSYSYDSLGDVLSITDPLGRVITAGYDATGNETSATTPGNHSQHWSYNADGTLATSTDPANHTTSYGYDTAGRRNSTTDPDGRVRLVQYDAAGCAVAITDAAGKVTSSTCDAAGRTLTVTDPDGHVDSFGYDADGNPTSHQDANQHSSTTAYDLADQPVSTTDANQHTTTYTYTGTGKLATATDPGTHLTRYTYDVLDRLVSVTDPDNRTTTFGYDLAGRQLSSRRPSGATSRTAYDAAGQVLSTTDENDRTTTYGYDVAGQPTTSVDPLGRTTTREYSADGRLAALDLPGGHSQTYGYDAAGRLTQFVDADGHVTGYDYDAAGLLTAEHQPGGRTTGYSYDSAGRLAVTTAPDATTTSRGYDDAGLLITVHHSALGASDTTFGYDAAGRRSSMTDGTGTSGYSYDAAGQLVSEHNGAGQSIGYSYDSAGRVVSLSYPSTRSGRSVTYRSVGYSYDDAGQLVSLTDWNSRTIGFDWTVDGQLSVQHDPNGVAQTTTYDPAGQVASIDTATTSATLAHFDYGYDGAGRLTSDTVPDPAASSISHQYGYDPVSQLTGVTSTPTGATSTTASYTATAAGLLTGNPGGDVLAYNSAEQLVSRTPAGGAATSYSYDAAGRRTGASTATVPATTSSYGYDPDGGLASVTSPSGAVTYTDDGDGLRQSRGDGTSTARFTWSTAGRLPLLLDDGSTSYLYGPSGTPVAQVDDSTGAIQYLHGDNLGSVRLITDTGGQVIGAASFDAYGVRTAHTGSADSAIGFTGNWTDPATGLVYLRARDYDPRTGQFLTVDPAENLTRQPYAYVANDPLGQTDPSGLVGCSSFTTSWGLDLCSSASIVKNEAIGVVKSQLAVDRQLIDPVGTVQSLVNACKAGLDSSGGARQCIDNLDPLGIGGLRAQVTQTWRDIQAGCTSAAGQDIGALQFQAGMAVAGGAEGVGLSAAAESGARVALGLRARVSMLEGDAGAIRVGRAPEYYGGQLTQDQAMRVAESWLGDGYREVSPGRYLSQDGKRAIRYGNHETGGAVQHIHFEAYQNGSSMENTRAVIIP